MDYMTLASDEELAKTIESLKANGINAVVTENKEEAKQKVLEMIPKQAEVMTMTSVTLETIGLPDILNESGEYDSVKTKLSGMNRETQSLEMQKLGAAPEWAVGSVHAVTQDGKILIASNTGSQLPAYSYGSMHVIWVVGTQKIVPTVEAAMRRINDYVLPLETVRARKAYGLPEDWNSNVSKLLIVNKEVNPDRINVVFVKEKLGF
ncbi:MAG TPA: LUD domain-containing protein [Candidatus Nitrosocosmicus sp.]|nr:LUD domain-containing protein [Candidatus Nitrosocosmicus sp.]